MKNMKKILVVGLILFLGLTIAPSINAFVFTGESQSEASSSEDSAYGCVFQGHGDDEFWWEWRVSAQDAFEEWCDYLPWVQTRPPVERISYNIKVLKVDYFYVIAHSDGQSDRFRASAPGVHYTADQLKEDMSDRPPIKLAILCCCEAMTNTGPGSLSWEFRKGQSEGTAVIGYANLREFKEKNGDFYDTLDWQDYLFGYINDGFTVKKAFDKACKKFERKDPSIANYVKFEGDPDVKVTTAVSVDSDAKIPTDPVDISVVTTDAGMSLTVELEEPASPSNVFDMVPMQELRGKMGGQTSK